MFVNGKRTLSQREAIEFAKPLGWTMSNGEYGAVRASMDASVVLLPASRPRYSVEATECIVRQLHPYAFTVPGRGAAGSAELEFLLARYRGTGFPVVGVGRRSGPLMPQIREPTDDAPDLIELDEDADAVAIQRWPDAQPWFREITREHNGVTEANRDEVIRRCELWKPSTREGRPATKWRPGSHPSMCMWSSSARHADGQTDQEIAEWMEVADLRPVHGAITRGDALWFALGAWPWAVFPPGSIPSRWWDDEEPWDALYEAMDARIRRGNGFLRAIAKPV